MSELNTVENEYRVEYLCTLNTDGNFCNSVKGFKSLLESYEKLKINDNKILWENSEFKLEVHDGVVLNSSFKYFHIKITNTNNENKSDFLALLKVIRAILSKVNNQPPEILWDDVSSEYAIKSYPIIHELENLMRKLITKFMITKVGLSWIHENIPKEVADSIKDKNSSKKQNYIYNTDFIQLSNFLFKEYSTTHPEEFVEKIKKANSINDLNLEELKKIIPLSNWTRYFNPIVKCSSEELRSKWSKLYDLRCKVAHNNFMDEEDFNNLLQNAQIIKQIILDAILNLDQIKINKNEIEELAENAAINLNKNYGDFVVKWKEVENLIASINAKKFNTSSENVDHLYTQGIFSEDVVKKFHELKTMRNLIVHDSNFELTVIQYSDLIKDLNWLHNYLSILTNQTKHKSGWYEISRSTDKKFLFVLKGSDGEVLLTSELFENKNTAINEIKSLKNSLKHKGNIASHSTTKNQLYFNVMSQGKILATSQFFSHKILKNINIILVQNNCQTDEIIDRTNSDKKTI